MVCSHLDAISFSCSLRRLSLKPCKGLKALTSTSFQKRRAFMNDKPDKADRAIQLNEVAASGSRLRLSWNTSNLSVIYFVLIIFLLAEVKGESLVGYSASGARTWLSLGTLHLGLRGNVEGTPLLFNLREQNIWGLVSGQENYIIITGARNNK